MAPRRVDRFTRNFLLSLALGRRRGDRLRVEPATARDRARRRERRRGGSALAETAASACRDTVEETPRRSPRRRGRSQPSERLCATGGLESERDRRDSRRENHETRRRRRRDLDPSKGGRSQALASSHGRGRAGDETARDLAPPRAEQRTPRDRRPRGQTGRPADGTGGEARSPRARSRDVLPSTARKGPAVGVTVSRRQATPDRRRKCPRQVRGNEREAAGAERGVPASRVARSPERCRPRQAVRGHGDKPQPPSTGARGRASRAGAKRTS